MERHYVQHQGDGRSHRNHEEGGHNSPSKQNVSASVARHSPSQDSDVVLTPPSSLLSSDQTLSTTAIESPNAFTSFQLPSDHSQEICTVAVCPKETFTIHDGYYNLAHGVRHLMDKSESKLFDFDKSETEKHLKDTLLGDERDNQFPSPPTRFYYSMSETWRGNTSNLTKHRLEKSNVKNSNRNLLVTEFAAAAPALSDMAPSAYTDPVQESEILFQCPKCKRHFSEWSSCHRHISSRKHGSKCKFLSPDDTSNSSCSSSAEPAASSSKKRRAMKPAILPSCLSSHAMLEIGYDPSSGWCDLQGRRAYIEDTHAIRFEKEYKFFGVFDGIFVSVMLYFSCVSCCIFSGTFLFLFTYILMNNDKYL